MEVLKDNITGLEAREGIQKSPQDSRKVRFCLCPDPGTGSSRRSSVLESH